MAETEARKRFPIWSIIILIFLMLLLFSMLTPNEFEDSRRGYTVTYSLFKDLLREGQVESVIMQGNELRGDLLKPAEIGPNKEMGERFSTYMPPFGDEQLLSTLEQNNVELRVVPAEPSPLAATLIAWAPWVLIIGIWIWFINRAYRNVAGGGLGKGSDLKRFLEPGGDKIIKVPDVKFSDVAGQENAKLEVSELVDYLRNPEQFHSLGAEAPHGVLLMGPPGTGKTLMARALAGEAGVPFASISGSEFIEVFVGVGASRVRRLFETAKQRAPSIIFIDELDSVGRTRGTGLGGGHDEREQTLNQILAEMDGFSPHEAVIVLAATNRPDVLDPALLRPGRFDRHVILDLPDIQDRVRLLEVHTRKVPLDSDVDFQRIAAGTPGFSGADIKNLVNEAAIAASRAKKQKVCMEHFDESRDKIMLGTVRTLAIQPEEHHRLAVHEAGHTLLAYYLPHADPLYKVTIIPRGHALGGTHQLPQEERHTLPEDYLHDRLCVILGGRTAEKELLHCVSSGADDDIKQATNLARAMVSRWGMSEEIGPVDLRDSDNHPFLGREMAQPRRYSESSAKAVDDAVRKILLEAEKRALEVVQQHRPQLDKLVSLLEQKETLYKEEIKQCLESDPNAGDKGSMST